ncbi:FAD-dependent oxidoreductase [Fulvivirga ulvae]|uniref:flavin monoamine oxidase family protein n=1 Tax=Fulvivirga ulvae TaxID=2904245 RepID=UPI001F32C4C3|nr:NAD(P)/FAD-dependent oxidoreductase [Fulvivirga ulvae]UII34272.1 FAD-dependent oxidoreductase [Fulvivirga ulvae]
MNRRKAIRGIGIGASAGLFLPSFLTSCKDDEDPKPAINYDGTVIVIGAGAAGLYTADLLVSQGIDVVILEAGDRIGGRVKSVRSFADFPVELGADVLRSQDSLFLQRIQDLNLNTVQVGTGRENIFFFNGQTVPASDLQNHTDFVAAQNFVNNIPAYSGDDKTILQAAQDAGLDSSVYRFIEGQVADPIGSDIGKVGINGVKSSLNLPTNGKSIALANNPIEDIFFSVFNHLIERVQLNTNVTSIDYSGEEVTVQTNNGSFSGSKVVMTVPVSILKSERISFVPSLPDSKAEALSRIGMDAAIKIFIKFNKNFWGQNTLMIYGGDLVPVYTSIGQELSVSNRTLMIEAFGQDADALRVLNDEDLKSAILNDLDNLFEGKASLNNDISELIKMDWTSDENIQGGYSYPLIGGSDEDRITLAQDINARVYFAGEATSVKYGTLDGAFDSGAVTAQSIITHIQEEQS